jgi:hypothetical protein
MITSKPERNILATTLERSQMMKFKLCGSSHDRRIFNSYIQNIVRQHRFFFFGFLDDEEAAMVNIKKTYE